MAIMIPDWQAKTQKYCVRATGCEDGEREGQQNVRFQHEETLLPLCFLLTVSVGSF